MKKKDLLFVIALWAIITPFACSTKLYDTFIFATKTHPYMMAFIKFAILATIGEMLGVRIKTGTYLPEKFGLLPRAFIWGLIGIVIASAFKIFCAGTPVLLESWGFEGATTALQAPFSWAKLGCAFGISVALNSIFAPVFMTFHKITDTHILQCNGSLKALITPIPVEKIMTQLNWKVQWNFVFKKTIPLFWFPAHTITFLLPPTLRVLFAAMLGIVLGVLLSTAAILSKKEN